MSNNIDVPDLETIKKRLKSYPTLSKLDIEAKAELIQDILKLKKKHNVVILGHNYMEPLVFECSSKEEQGDSYGLSVYASKTDAEYIIFNGVRFMAETAKILNPNKTILIADKSAGCSLADNFDSENVRQLKKKYPGVPVMIYINSYADAKTECDVVCTSANAKKLAMDMPGDKLIFVPDMLFAANLSEELKNKKTVLYPGKDNNIRGSVCEVHEKFSLDDIKAVRKTFEIPKNHPNRLIYAHWECSPEVLREVDFFGSTTQIRNDLAKRIKEGTIKRAFIASECELTSNLAAEFPQVEFSTACSVRCNHMAKITLEKLHKILLAIDNKDNDLSALKKFEVNLNAETIEKAKKPIQRMLDMSK